MNEVKDLELTYNKCVAQGYLQEPEDVDIEEAKSLLKNAEFDNKSLKEITPLIEKNKNYGMLWTNHYEIIRQLVAGILLLEKVKSENHQCRNHSVV